MHSIKGGKFIIILFLTVFLLIPIKAEAINGISVILEGQQLEFDVPPQIVEGRTLLPLRAIFEAFGLEIVWDDQTKTITGTSENKDIVLRIDDLNAYVNERKIVLDVPPKILNGRTLVPVRFIAESLDMNVNWISETRTVMIDHKNKIEFKDLLLEDIVREKINKPIGDIYKDEVLMITEILLKDTTNGGGGYKQISSLEGIQYLKNLEILEIESALVEDITPIGELYSLQELDLMNNHISDISAIQNLINIERLVLGGNKIIDVSYLKNLSALKFLNINGNPITSESLNELLQELVSIGADGLLGYGYEFTTFTDFIKSNVKLAIDENSSGEEIEKYLEINFGTLDTISGTVKFEFTVIENEYQYFPEDIKIWTEYDSWDFWHVFESIKYTNSQKEEYRDQLKEHQKKIGETLIELMPGKKLTGCYHHGWYTYPNIRVDYNSQSYFTWTNYRQPDIMSDTSVYHQTKPSTFRWFTKYDDEL